VALIIDSLFYVFSCRNLNLNIWQYNPFSNKFINWTVIVGLLLMLAVIYLPFLQNVFETVPLDFIDWLLLGGVGFINLFLIEFMKYLFMSKKISN
jgi:Ca2+-transporting ATPase